MRLVTIGTGTVALTAARVCAGHYVEAGSARVLLDCGSGITHRLAELGLPWHELTHVAITHFHADHISDIATLVFAWKYGMLPARSAPLVLVGPVGIAELLERLISAFGDWLRDPGFALDVREIAPGESIDIGEGTTLRAIPV